MEYELMMNGNVKIGMIAPEFEAVTTFGNVRLSDYKGKWLVLFSHPGDFTPVCTTEMIGFARMYNCFKELNTELLGLSIDSNPSHLAWVYEIYCRTGIEIPFPIIADRTGQIARKYGMVSNEVDSTQTVRNVFIIDDKQKVRAILIYPLEIGRNISEILRTIQALQTADRNKVVLPANWIPCQPGIMLKPNTYDELKNRIQQIEKNKNGITWYLAFQDLQCCEKLNCSEKRNIENLKDTE